MKFFKLFFALWVFGIISALTGCGKTSDEEKDDKLLIYTSFYGAYDLVNKIGGEKIELYNAVPSGTEPHNWEPTAGDMLNFSKADILFYNGAGLEGWIDTVKEAIKEENVKFVELSQGIELIRYNEKGDFSDPHIWLDPSNAKKEAFTIKEALCEADSENADYYNKNYDDFSEKADKLNEDFTQMTKNAGKKTIIVAHEAYGYLCKAYGLEQLAIEGAAAESEPSPAKMAEISKYVKDNGIKYIFFEELTAKKAAETIAEETGAELVPLNPFEGVLDESDDYFSVMYKNLENIKKALE